MNEDSSTAPADLGRCDSCNAEGRVQVRAPSGGTLVFCGHHYKVNEVDLITWKITGDTRSALVPA